MVSSELSQIPIIYLCVLDSGSSPHTVGLRCTISNLNSQFSSTVCFSVFLPPVGVMCTISNLNSQFSSTVCFSVFLRCTISNLNSQFLSTVCFSVFLPHVGVMCTISNLNSQFSSTVCLLISGVFSQISNLNRVLGSKP